MTDLRAQPTTTLDPGAAHTARLHLAFASLEAIALGVLANAPVVALRSLGSPPWQLALQLVPSSLGVLLELYLGARMARRLKVPYVCAATAMFALATFGMTCVRDPLWFNALHGVGLLGQIVAQMAFASIVRGAYPAAVRGAIAGRVRSASSLAFFAAALATAMALDAFANTEQELRAARWSIGVAATAALAAAFAASRIRAGDAAYGEPAADGAFDAARMANRIVRRDARFRRYLIAAAIAAVGTLMTSPYVNVLLVRDLDLDFLPTLAIAQLIPQLCAFATSGPWGRLSDRTNVWRLFGVIRGAWGLGLIGLGAAAALATASPDAALVVAIAAKVLVGVVMSGSWLLHWQLGVAHFARVGPDTSRYMSLVAAVSGLARLVGPGFGALVLVATGALLPVFTVGGVLLLCSARLCRSAYRTERDDPRFATAAAFEGSDPTEGTHGARRCR